MSDAAKPAARKYQSFAEFYPFYLSEHRHPVSTLVQAGHVPWLVRDRGMELDEAYAYASGVMLQNMLAEEAQEGFAAFLEKRPPDWG